MTGCPVCYRFVTADRELIRMMVIRERLRTGATTFNIKKTLCENCYRIGFSARSHTVGEAGKSLDATEAGSTSDTSPLPTFFDPMCGGVITPDHRYSSWRYRWKLMYRRFLRRKNP